MRLSWVMLCIIFFSNAHFNLGQTIKTLNIQVVENEFQLSFQIEQSHSFREKYLVNIYSSHDGYEKPLDVVINDVSPGVVKSVSFPILETIGYFQGVVQFKLEAVATFFPVKILPASTTKFRKKKDYQVDWEDINESGVYNVVLHYEDSVTSLADYVAGNSFSANFPKNIEPGDYYIVVSPVESPELESDKFPITVKRNVTAIIAISAALAGGTGFLLFSGGETGTGGSQLPDPPGTPN